MLLRVVLLQKPAQLALSARTNITTEQRSGENTHKLTASGTRRVKSERDSRRHLSPTAFLALA